MNTENLGSDYSGGDYDKWMSRNFPEYDPACASVTVNVIKLDIEINDTPATSDDYVGMREGTPLSVATTHCRVRAVGLNGSVKLLLSSPQSRLTFESNPNVTVSKGWSSFDIQGNIKSTAIGDAKIQFYDGNGTAFGDADATVFWFDNSHINVSADGSYTIQSTAIGSAALAPMSGVGVYFSAASTIMPAGLNGNAPQISPLRIGIKQNVLSAGRSIIYQHPVFATGTPVGTIAKVPATFYRLLAINATIDDAFSGADVPVYYRGGAALAIPIGLTGGAAAKSSDTPSLGSLLIQTLSVTPVSGGTSVNVNYIASYAIHDSFRTWAVCLNKNANDYVCLRETSWKLDADSEISGIQKAETNPDGPVSNQPVNGPPFANGTPIGPFVPDPVVITIP